MSGREDPWPSYGLLLTSVTASVAVEGAVPPSGAQGVVVNMLLGASLILAFHIARTSRMLVALAYAVALGAVIVAVVSAATGAIGEGTGRLVTAAVAAFGPPAVAVGVIRSLQKSGRVQVQAVSGVLALYMLLGMLFAFLYAAIDRLGGAPFFANGAAVTASRCLYFSFTTLTTVGYGDFTARTNLGHTLAIFEALIGQIYLVTVVSLIVGNLGRAHPRRS
jgi:Ion channel